MIVARRFICRAGPPINWPRSFPQDVAYLDGPQLDGQGRVMIPPALLDHAKLGREVVVAGVHDHLEIWDRAAWRRELAEVEGSAEDVAEHLAAKRD